MSNERVKATIAKIDSALRIIEGGDGDDTPERRARLNERDALRYEALSRRHEELMAKRGATIERLRNEMRDRLRRKDTTIEELGAELEAKVQAGDARRHEALLLEHETLARKYAALRERAINAVVGLDGVIAAARAGGQ